MASSLHAAARKRSARAGKRRGVHDIVLQVDKFFGSLLPETGDDVVTNVVLLGDAPLRSGQSFGKTGHAKAPLKAITAALARDYVVICTRERYTSQHCCVCGARLVDPYKVMAARADLDSTLDVYAPMRKTLKGGCWKLRACLSPECSAAAAAHGEKPTTPFAGPLPAYLRPLPGTLGSELDPSEIAFPAARIWHRDVTAALSLARAGLAALLGLARPAYLSRAHAEEPDAHPVPRYPTPADLVQASSALFSHQAPSNGSPQPSSSSLACHPNSSTREEGGTRRGRRTTQ